jgi:hypothetical protein
MTGLAGIEGTTAGVHTLRVRQAGPRRYEVLDDAGDVMGVTADEARAMTSAMFSADLIGQQGGSVRVMADHDGGMAEVYSVRRV